MLSTLPDYHLGIFTNINRPDSGLLRLMVHLYIADLILGEEPWFNATQLCDSTSNIHMRQTEGLTFPPTVEGNILNLAMSDDEKMKQYQKKEKTNDSSNRLVEEYVGEYGNFAYGNVSVYISDEEEDLLEMHYGNNGYFDLIALPGQHTFLPIGNRVPSDSINLGRIYFYEGEGGSIDFLEIPAFEVADPPMFERGLLLEDAPPPELC